ncbi:CCR4-NOT transcription complex subunit 4 [Phyllostomus discolor]|uniref:CCR4-NOT transcription complex subunit 4 n=1 Tax=Phyllostomus discolor TaxID=89673 RepID=A0A833Z758_9CHIR|nr:CCR4-NOT transcription complex subunit 4 [Phyllostomus discolor]
MISIFSLAPVATKFADFVGIEFALMKTGFVLHVESKRHKGKNKQMGSHQNKKLLHSIKMKREPTVWESIFANDTSDKGLISKIFPPYPEDPAVYKPLSQEELQRIKNEKKQKQNERKQKISENRKHLASVRVVQKNLVFVVGLSQRLADPEVLKRPEYFGKFGKIHKVVINNSTSYAGSQGPSASAYVTYIRSEDALRAIQCVNNVVVDGRTLKASLGTTKYCSYFLKNMQCPKPDCMYLHELGDEAASFTKEEMQAGKHQEYEQKLLQELYKLNPNFLQLSTGSVDKNKNKVTPLQRLKGLSRTRRTRP